MKILIKIAYDGKNYCGWQVQKNGISIQGTVCEAAKQVYGEKVNVTGCSRTDSGVHAREYFCTLETSEKAPCIPLDRLPTALNRYLPEDVTVFEAYVVSADFHARYGVKEKTYEYVFDNGDQRDPFLFKRAWHIAKPLDALLMDEAAKAFIGEHDFSAFMASGSSVTDTVRTVTAASVKREGSKVVFSITGNGFLYNMVRIMAGTLYYVSIGKTDAKGIGDIINSGDRALAGITAPPDGLYLAQVKYE
jgi:tRNA pseudouridine38-40 synthase